MHLGFIISNEISKCIRILSPSFKICLINERLQQKTMKTYSNVCFICNCAKYICVMVKMNFSLLTYFLQID